MGTGEDMPSGESIVARTFPIGVRREDFDIVKLSEVQTAALYTLRELPQQARTRSSRRVIEVVGPRRFEERDRARLERHGKFVGRGAQLG